MNKEKVLLLRQFEKRQNIAGCDDYTKAFIDRYQVKLMRNLKRWLIRHKMGKWVFDWELPSDIINNKKIIIVGEIFSWNPNYLLEYLRKRCPQAHIIYWIRNTLFSENYHTGITSNNIQEFLKGQKALKVHVASFDKGDCRKYDLMYAPQNMDYLGWGNFFLLEGNVEHNENKRDIIWLGKDKGRVQLLGKLKKYFDNHHVSYRLQVVREPNTNYAPDMDAILIDKSIPYKQYLTDVMESKAILDLYQEGQDGLTFRPIEAMMLKKKLITNLLDIDTYDFYRKENVFIIGKDNLAQLPEFLDSSYQDIPDKIIENYTFQGMIRHIYRQMQWDLTELE